MKRTYKFIYFHDNIGLEVLDHVLVKYDPGNFGEIRLSIIVTIAAAQFDCFSAQYAALYCCIVLHCKLLYDAIR